MCNPRATLCTLRIDQRRLWNTQSCCGLICDVDHHRYDSYRFSSYIYVTKSNCTILLQFSRRILLPSICRIFLSFLIVRMNLFLQLCRYTTFNVDFFEIMTMSSRHPKKVPDIHRECVITTIGAEMDAYMIRCADSA